MSRFYMTCPLWTPPNPPPIEDQVSPVGYDIRWEPPHTCEFANRNDPTDIFEQGDFRPRDTSAILARTYRCTTHRRRPTIHMHEWNANRLRRTLIRNSNRIENIFLTDQGRGHQGRPYPPDWPHTHNRWGNTVWVTKRPRPITTHSTW